MKRIRVMTGLLMAAAFAAGMAQAAPIGTTFTYQGELTHQGQALNEAVDFRFTLFDGPNAVANQIGATIEILAWPVTDGKFTVPLDFGAAAMSGEARFLDIQVRHPSGAGAYTTLTPRQELTPTPFAIGLSLPYSAAYPAAGNVFSVTNTGLGRAISAQITDPTNPEAALNAVTLGTGPAGAFRNDSGGDALHANSFFSGRAIFGQTTGASNNGKAIHGLMTDTNGADLASAVRGENQSQTALGVGVYGTQDGSGFGVLGTTPSGIGVVGEVDRRASGRDPNGGTAGGGSQFSGWGVFGVGHGVDTGGVFGLHEMTMGTDAGVFGETNSGESGAKGVHGLASSTDSAETHGVFGESMSVIGNGVFGRGAYGVTGEGNAAGLRGIATDMSSYGVQAIGFGGALSSPAIRADNFGGPAIAGYGDQGVRGEGDSAGVVGVTFDVNGVGGSFTNFDGGIALRANGDAYVDGTLSAKVIEVLGADLAERFPASEQVEPGTVMEIDVAHPGQLCMSRTSYNRRVAGVVSGAGDLPVGAVLGKISGNDAPPIALSGRVWVKCDATEHAIQPGDLMTTSATPGHAMAVRNHDRAGGAIIGKAMTALPQGETGLVLVLVNLQ